MAIIDCPECKKEVSTQANTCPHCGYSIQNYLLEDRGGERKSKGLAVALAFVLGGFGIHKFYLGQPGWGLLYLLFCWTFIPAIAGLIEAIIYAFASDAEFQTKYVATS
jgi:TM2 domain-containing membrane protein YozV